MNPKILLIALCSFMSMNVAAYSPFVDNDGYFLEHLKRKRYDIDTAANAVVLYESGIYKMYRQPDGSLRFSKYTRRIVKILTAKGMSEADMAFAFPGSGGFDGQLKQISAKTYTLEGDKINVTGFDKKAISLETAPGNYKLLKFSMPAITEGCVLDYEFEVDHYATIQFGDWSFQDKIPVIHSEFATTFLDEFQMSFVTRTNEPYKQLEPKEVMAMADIDMPLAYTLPATKYSKTTTMRWVRRNLPAIIEEPHLYSIINYIDGVDMYIAGSPYNDEFKLGSWQDFNRTVNARLSLFTSGMNNNQAIAGVVKDIFKDVTCKTGLDSAKCIFRYVRKNYTATSRYFDIQDGKLKKVIEEKKGTSTDINILLHKLYQYAGITSNVVLIGVRERGKLLPDCPVLDNVNYLICRVETDGQVYNLDASDKYNAFGVLPLSCYNGFAWGVSEKGFAVIISPDSIKERMLVNVSTENTDKDNYILKIDQVMGDVSGSITRKSWLTDKNKIEEYIRLIVKNMPFDASLLEYEAGNVAEPDEPLKFSFKVKLTFGKEDKMFFVPSMFNFYDDNPFKSSRRIFPVEMPYALDYIFQFTLSLPEGYSIEEGPKSLLCKLNDRNTYNYRFNYSEENNTMTLSTRMKIQETFFDAAHYQVIKSFFDSVIAQQQKPVLMVKKG